jgi:hypothetical protein
MKHVFTVQLRKTIAGKTFSEIMKFEAENSFDIACQIRDINAGRQEPLWDSYVIQFVAKRWPVYENGQYVGHFTEAEALAAKKRPGSWPPRSDYDKSPDEKKSN